MQNFSSLKEMLAGIRTLPESVSTEEKTATFFREYEERGLDPLNVLRLAHLTKSSDDEQKTTFSPFTEKQEKIFKEEKDRISQASTWLRRGLVGTTLLTLTPFVGAVPFVSDWAIQKPSNNLNLMIGLTGVSAGINIINFIATGTIPNVQTSSAEKARLGRVAVNATMKELSCELQIMSHQSPDEAKLIAQAIQIDVIRDRMMSAFPSEDYKVDVDEGVNKLRRAQCRVLGLQPSFKEPAKVRLQTPYHSSSLNLPVCDKV
jgi:hypothetical protein